MVKFLRSRLPKPKPFKYQPWFYDEEEEEFKDRVADAEKRYHGEVEQGEVKKNVRFNFRESGASPSSPATKGRSPRFERRYEKANPLRLLAIIAFLLGLVWFIFTR